MYYRAFFVALVYLAWAPLAWGVTYYVNNSAGSDANSCATAQSSGASAKATIAAGTACLSGGDTLHIEQGTGTYDHAWGLNAIPNGEGSWSTATIIEGELDGSGNRLVTVQPTSGTDVIYESGRWKIFKDFIIDAVNVSSQGIRIQDALNDGGPVEYIRIQNMEIKNGPGNCVGYFWRTNIDPLGGVGFTEVLNNVMHDCGSTNQHHIIYPVGNDHLFENNEFYNAPVGHCFHLFEDATNSHRNTVRYNRIHDCGSRGLLIGSGDDNIAHHNVVYDACLVAGAGCNSAEIRFGSSGDNNRMFNNTIHNGSGRCMRIATGQINAIVRNNICRANNSDTILDDGITSTISNNLLGTDPTFTNEAGNDFTLAAGSVAEDAGVDVGLGFNGAAPEQGAYEILLYASGEIGNVDASTMAVNFVNNFHPPLLPASSITGFTVGGIACTPSVSSAARFGDNQIRLVLSCAAVAGDSPTFSYSAGNVTDSADIGETFQPLHAITAQGVTNNVAGSSVLLTQTYARFKAWEGAIDSTDWKADEDASRNMMAPGNIRLRLKLAGTGGDPDSQGYRLRVSEDAGAYTDIGSSCISENICLATHPTVQNLKETAEQLTSDHASNIAGAFISSAGGVPSIDLAQDSESEMEYSLATDAGGGDIDGKQFCFRLYTDAGDALNAYDVTPCLTIAAPFLSQQGGQVSSGGGLSQ